MCCFALGVVRRRKVPLLVYAITGAAVGAYTMMNSFHRVNQFATVHNPVLRSVWVLVLVGFWGISIIYVIQTTAKVWQRFRATARAHRHG